MASVTHGELIVDLIGNPKKREVTTRFGKMDLDEFVFRFPNNEIETVWIFSILPLKRGKAQQAKVTFRWKEENTEIVENAERQQWIDSVLISAVEQLIETMFLS